MARAKGHVALARALSKMGVMSRADAARRIRAGEIVVNGEVVTDPDHAVVPEHANIRVAGATIHHEPALTILFHKPRGVVTTRSDPEGRSTVFDVLGTLPRYVAPVGRLDVASTGLLLLTNDTRLADWLLDPTHGVSRVYIVTVRGELSDETADRVRAGVRADGDLLRAREVEVLKRSRRETHVRVVLVEGKNRELRRLFAACGHEVTRLKRVAFGGLELGSLAPGRWRVLAPAELRRAFPCAPIKDS
jgi:23S rRNA pseudouridine2605 synthase